MSLAITLTTLHFDFTENKNQFALSIKSTCLHYVISYYSHRVFFYLLHVLNSLPHSLNFTPSPTFSFFSYYPWPIKASCCLHVSLSLTLHATLLRISVLISLPYFPLFITTMCYLPLTHLASLFSSLHFTHCLIHPLNPSPSLPSSLPPCINLHLILSPLSNSKTDRHR